MRSGVFATAQLCRIRADGKTGHLCGEGRWRTAYGRPAGTVLPLLTCAVYVLAVLILIWPGGIPVNARMGVSHNAVLLAALVGVIRAARHRRLDRLERRPWWILCASLLTLAVSGAALGAMGPEGLTRLSPAMIVGVGLHLVTLMLMLVGLLSFRAQPLDHRERLKLGLDVMTAAGGAFMALWYLIISPALAGTTQRTTVQVLVLATITVADMVVIVGAGTVFYRGVRQVSRRPMRLVLAAVTWYLALDIILSFTPAAGTGELPGWVAAAMITPVFLIAMAAEEQCRGATAGAAEQRVERLAGAVAPLPYLGLSAGFGIFALAAAESGPYPWAGLVACSIVMTGGVVARQIVAMRENHRLMLTDGLTGLANRTRLTRAVRGAVERGRRTGRPVGLLLIDLNGFKQVNDTLGHDAGDMLLVAFADLLRAATPPGGTAGRLGGDEFAVVLPDAGTEGAGAATEVAQLILARAAESPIDYRGTPMRLRASIGVAVSEAGTVDDRDLLQHADQAMYTAKRRGTQGWHRYGDDPATELAAAVDDGRLRLDYRPVHSLTTGAVIAVQPRVSWPHPRLGLIDEPELRPVAERAGLGAALLGWTVQTAGRQLGAWQGRLPADRSLRLSIRVSAAELAADRFADDLLARLTRGGTAPSDLVLEVDDTTLPGGAALTELRRHGVRVALDAFTTGYTAYSEAVDLLKVGDCLVDGTPGATVDCVVRLGRILHGGDGPDRSGPLSADEVTTLLHSRPSAEPSMA
ncbi:bifunctional diguanylate cyclase/phosphodiesterase [Actinoplanes sichuanensis]|uniref:Diguanylate cyclase domain-containing protein n=1 Tax=Actinoplanes sichuanensis TaxID=512349 RepID=A0ABW4A5S9_9ACTN|nr:diguanylate cyclase [Actinoplanes sichuanensis]BEL05122.1 bifunctional diguanylate cyclase/phosphodiesterase [Actinoplanes sichuanensis]